MPLRDHFRPPLATIRRGKNSTAGAHGHCPAASQAVAPGYVSAPRVRAGPTHWRSMSPLTRRKPRRPSHLRKPDSGGATAVCTAAPSMAIETELPDDDEYECRIYDAERGRTLVAAIEMVSPANKDRPEKRNAFVGKCAALLRNGVAVSVVGHRDHPLLQSVRGTDDIPWPPRPDAWPRAGRGVRRVMQVGCKSDRAVLETWSHPLIVGQPLPTLPLWLTDTLSVPLDLRGGVYEQACEDLRIPG